MTDLSASTAAALPCEEDHHRPHLSLSEGLCLDNAVVGQHIGLEETDDGLWAIHFNTIPVPTLDEPDYSVSD